MNLVITSRKSARKVATAQELWRLSLLHLNQGDQGGQPIGQNLVFLMMETQGNLTNPDSNLRVNKTCPLHVKIFSLICLHLSCSMGLFACVSVKHGFIQK